MNPIFLVRTCCLLLALGLGLAQAAAAQSSLLAYRSASLPERPQRIVSLDDLSTELLLSLGVQPVGVANLDGYRRWVDLDGEGLADSQALGSAQQPDLEAIAALQADLIVGVSYLHAGLFERLDSLAPTLIYRVSLEPSGRDAVDTGAALLEHLAGLTGREAQARRVLAELDAALAAAQAAADAAGVSERPLAVLYPLVRQGVFIASNEQTLIASLATRLGGGTPWPLASGRSLHRRLDLHDLVDQPQASLLFIGGQERAPFFATPLWQALPVAQQRRYAFLATPYWTFGGPRSAARIALQMAEAWRGMPQENLGR